MSDKIYYAKHPVDGSVIAIRHGVDGYYPGIDNLDPNEVDSWNIYAGNSDAEVKAAVACSMFGCWDNFDALVKAEEKS